jgi:hypothetical protein
MRRERPRHLAPDPRRSKRIALILCAVAAALLLLLLARLADRPDGPGEVVEAALMAANEGRYQEANSYLSESARRASEALGAVLGIQLQESWDNETRHGQLRAVRIDKVDVLGEGAVVEYTLVYNDGDTSSDDVRLIKEHGEWKASS